MLIEESQTTTPAVAETARKSSLDLGQMAPADFGRFCDALRAAAEFNRREQPSIPSSPIEGVLDYSQGGTIVDIGCAHLDESLPNGQKARSEAAYTMLALGTVVMGRWMKARGYDVVVPELETLTWGATKT